MKRDNVTKGYIPLNLDRFIEKVQTNLQNAYPNKRVTKIQAASWLAMKLEKEPIKAKKRKKTIIFEPDFKKYFEGILE